MPYVDWKTFLDAAATLRCDHCRSHLDLSFHEYIFGYRHEFASGKVLTTCLEHVRLLYDQNPMPELK